jgi:gamma-glutamyltranspeptidase / glutathione hydrolase
MDLDRRTFLVGMATALVAPRFEAADGPRQLVAGHPQAAEAGNAVLAAGGNAVDAVVAAALVAGVVAVPLTGIGGYGGHLVLAGLPGGKVSAIDFNSAAPAALTPDYFKVNERGEVKGDANTYGWLAVGVPGVLAGLQLALDKYGTKKFSNLAQPAAKLAHDGFPVNKRFADALRTAKARLANDAGSAKLFLRNGEPLKEGATFRNPDLTRLLETLAEAGSVGPFYKGKIADAIAGAVQANGGLVTATDLAAYQALEVTPLALDWTGYTVHTPPPTSGGLTVLQTLAALKALDEAVSAGPAFVEALRVAWTDRLALIGDPAHVDVPIKRLLSEEYAKQTAERVRAAVRDKKPIEGKSDGRTAGGTLHLNAVDAAGLTVALTFTHGGHFGAQVTVDGLGLVLGHGVSRFDPRPGRPNSPGPGKRPLHNMCPTVVTKAGVPALAVGAAGGRRIVNAVANVLAYRLGDNLSLEAAVKAPRVHTEGGLTLTAEAGYPGVAAFKAAGYTVTTGAVGSLHATEREAKTGEVKPAAR